MLKVEIHGSGEPLVLLHGLTHRRQAWHPLLEHLTDHREVILVDLPGHGESPDLFVPHGSTVEDVFRDALTATFDALGIEKPHVAGNSMGGRIALEAAADDLVCSATALSPAAFWHGPIDFAYTRLLFHWGAYSAPLVAPIVPLMARTVFGRNFMCRWVIQHPGRLDPEVLIDDMRAMMRALPAMRKIFPAAHPFDRMIAPEIPVTIAWGSGDLLLPLYQAENAKRQLPNAKHVRLPDCGHVPMTDNPELVAQVLLEGSSAGYREAARA